MKHARSDYDRIQDPAGLIADDEPVFLIRAKDIVSAGAVRDWANRAESVGASPEIVAAAREHAARMDAWRPKQVPDMPVTRLDPEAT